MRKIGYARVSSKDQSLDRQIAALIAEGCEPKDIFQEKASGKSFHGRPQLEKAINHLGTGDCLVVAEWDRATRSMMDGLAIIERIKNRGSLLKVLDRSYFDLTTEFGCAMIGLLSALASDERKRILARCAGGRKAAQARGVKFGPKPKLSVHQVQEARRRILEGNESARTVAKSFGVHHATVIAAVR